MFNKNFTCTVTTDESGHFQSSTTVEGTHLFNVYAQIYVVLISPPDTKLAGTFQIAPAAAQEFSASTSEKVDLGEWRIAMATNSVVASGTTSPVRANAQLVVQFEARPA